MNHTLKRKHEDDDTEHTDQSYEINDKYFVKENNLLDLSLNNSKKNSLSENLSDSDLDLSNDNLKINKKQLVNKQSDETKATLFKKQDLSSKFEVFDDELLGRKFKSSDSNNEAAFTESLASTSQTFGYKLMKKMGYRDGEGIGLKPGIVKPIDESNQVGKQGLGFKKKNFEKVENWDYENDPVTGIENVEWLINDDVDVPSLDTLKQWEKIGKKKRTLNDETHFCSSDTLIQVLTCKSIFDDLDGKEMTFARFRSNPFEAIGSRFFQNRAALKMANLDAVFDFMFTDPKYSNGQSKIENDEPLYFCDVCAGPGGFSEYVLWRKKWLAKGFGMTLKEDNDFKLDEFLAGQAEYFEPYYGENGLNGDGDVTKPQNLKEFQRFVVEQTNHKGVHFMMADGGFSVEGNENIQEILSKQLYLCQFLCALSVLRIGGNFVCKIFDLFTPFSVGLIYLMYSCFDRISIHKPVTSRPANSERYLICESARQSKDVIYNYLFKINNTLNKTFRDEKSDEDVNEIVPLDILRSDTKFFNYIYDSNERLGKIQVLNLKKIQAFATNKSLFDPRQSELISECLNMWKIPNLDRSIFGTGQKRHHNNKHRNNSKFKEKVKVIPINPKHLFDKFNSELLNKYGFDLHSFMTIRNSNELNYNSLKENFKKCSIYDYKTIIGSGQLVLLMGCSRSIVYELEIDSPLNCFPKSIGEKYNNYDVAFDNWKSLSGLNIELPRETLLIAEKVVEFRGSGSSQQSSNAIHIIDALFIEGECLIYNNRLNIQSIEERHSKLKIFIKSISKKSRKELNTIRLKELIDIEDIQSNIFNNLVHRAPKNETTRFKNGIHIPLDFATENYVYPNGIYFLKYISNPWSLVLSKSSGKKYFFNSFNNSSTYEFPNDPKLYSDPKYYFDNLMIWRFSTDENNESSDVITKEKFIEFLKKFK